MLDSRGYKDSGKSQALNRMDKTCAKILARWEHTVVRYRLVSGRHLWQSVELSREGTGDSSRNKDRVGIRYTEMKPGDWRKKGHPGQRKCTSPLIKMLFVFSLSFLAGWPGTNRASETLMYK